ncbi:MAG: carboxy-S-adenosyl-L-methionine synthase CmoA [Desulfobacterales bacterium]|nr:carboxy-S-adenosyl-L-methionine synthase CmoA [Desulfobacterales bacterium]
MEKDRVFAQKKDKVKPFAFNREVTRVFDDMLVRSVPMYTESIKRQAQLTQRYYQPGSRIYDLGCSHGNIGLLVMAQFKDAPFKMVGVDSSKPMIEKYRNRLEAIHCPDRVDLVCGYMEDVAIEDASVVLINLTLQFLDVEKRDRLMEKIYQGMRPGGILLLTEKTFHASELINETQLSFYRQFKRENGYSELEISQKRDALEEVLIPDTLETHMERLQRVGFVHRDVWLKWFNFAGIMAVKSPEQ